MKKWHDIQKFALLFLCWTFLSVSAWAQGRLVNTASTDGNDFWLAFVSNNGMSNQETSLECIIYCTLSEPAKQEITIYVQFGTTQRTITIPAGQTMGKFEADATDRANMYSYINKNTGEEQEQIVSKGIRVYTKQHGVAFSCFGYCKVGEGGRITQDAFLVLPATALGKEYYVQTYWTSVSSNEFVVIATEDSTEIRIELPDGVSTYKGVTGTIKKLLPKKGDSYLVPSLSFGSAAEARIDLSGTTICATKPVAVFAANEAAKAPVDGSYSEDFMMEQVPSLHNLGTQFYLGKAAHTAENRFNVLAVYPQTDVTMSCTDSTGAISELYTFTLGVGQTLYDVAGEDYVQLFEEHSHLMVLTSQPTLCYSYLTCGAVNQERIDRTRINWGNPSTAMVPTWEQRVKKISFVTQPLEPEKKFAEFQVHYVQVVAKTADAATFTLDGNAVSASEFKPFPANREMAFANVEIHTDGRHLLSTTGDGFIGYVYGMTNGQAYQYTLGFNPQNNKDSLFITDADSIMSPQSYELERTASGWYLRQLHDWFDMDSARLDSAWICDSTRVNFHIRSKDNVSNDTVKWRVYHLQLVSDSFARRDKLMFDTIVRPVDNVIPDWNHFFTSDHSQDFLPPQQRDPFDLYEVEMMIYRGHLVCKELMHDVDTLHTIVRVNRSYNDTILRRLVCITDTVQCFYDNPTHTDAHAPASLAKTTFMSEGNPLWKEDPYIETLQLGENYYSRHYQTIYGCDSIATFLLYVCDTVHARVDTTLCANQILSFEGSEYFQGVTFDHEGTYLDTLKTHDCDAMIKFYDPDSLFHGCDSILELTLHFCDTFNIYARDTFCANDTWTYQWQRDGRINKDSLVRELHISPSSVDQWLEFRDTTKTISCPNCQDGGCDSIFILQLYVAAPSKETITDRYCGQYYDPDSGTLKDQPYSWSTCTSDSVWDTNNNCRILKDSIWRMALGTTNTFIDSLLTHNGCDSITNLVLTRDSAFLQVEYWRMGNNETYTWKGHGPDDGDIVFGPLPVRDNPYIFHDSDSCVTGCDSIYRLEIKIAQSFEDTVTARICDDSTFVWENHTSANKYAPTTAGPRTLYDATNGKYITSSQLYGRKVGADGYSEGVYTIVDSMKMIRTVGGEDLEMDSIWILKLTVDSTYNYHRYDTICDDASILFKDKTYYGKDYKQLHPAFGYFEKTEKWNVGSCQCDSVVTMHLTVAPRFYQFDSIRICDDCTQNWPHRTDSHGDSIPVHLDKAGIYTLWDSTTTYLGCDSVYELRVLVTPSYDTLDLHHEMCDNEEFTWTGHKAKDLVTDTLIKGWSAGTYILWDSLKTFSYGCDSVYKLTLTIHPTYKFDNSIAMCDNDTLTWQGSLFVGSKFSGTPAATPYKTVSTGSYVDTAFYADQSQFGCDSTYCLALRVFQTFYQKEDSVICQDDSFVWKNHEGHTLVDATGRTIDISSISSQYGEYTLIDHLYNTECASCTSGNGCDSIYELHVKVNPSYKNARVVEQPVTICELDVPYIWTGHKDAFTPSGYKEFLDPGSYLDTLSTKDCECDSVVNLILTIVDNSPRVIDTAVCQNEPAFTIGAKKYKVSPKDSLSGLHTIVSSIPIGTSCFYQETINIRIDSVYNYVVYDTVCQHIGDTYIWQLHPDIAPISISKAGKQTIVDAQKTKNGCDCDSVWTLYLNVLPSYHIYDTVTISNEQTTRWQDTVYGGVLATRPQDAEYYVTVLKDTTIHTPLTTKPVGTHVCDSILDHTIRVGKVFRDTTYDYTCAGSAYVWNITSPIDSTVTSDSITNIPAVGTHGYFYHKCKTAMNFDSIYTLDLYTAPTYQLTHKDTVCQTDTYIWEGHENRPLYYKDIPISSDSIPTTDSAKWITIVDRLTTEKEIRTRQAGSTTWETKPFACDSVWTLNLYIAPIYTGDVNKITDHLTLRNTDTISWEGSLYKGADFTQPIDESKYTNVFTVTKDTTDSRSHTTKIGELKSSLACDSIRFLDLKMNYFYTMTDTICRGSIYSWKPADMASGHVSLNGKVVYSISTNEAGLWKYIDSWKTNSNQDSIYELNLLVPPSYAYYDTIMMSNEEDTVWHGRHYAGELSKHAGEEGYTLLHEGDNHDTDSHPAYYDATHFCDSIYYLTIRIGDVFRDTTFDTSCGNEAYVWYGKDAYGQDFIRKTIQPSAWGEKSIYEDNIVYHTTQNYDSIYYLKLTILPYYLITPERTTVDSLCQGNEYIWEKHEGEGHKLYLYSADKAQPITDLRAFTATLPVGSYTFHDSIGTTLGCDSVWALTLRVDSVYNIPTSFTICDNDTLEWEHRLYVGKNFQGVYDDSKYFAVIKGLEPQAEFTDDSLYHTIHGCDSLRRLSLRINPTYLNVAAKDTVVAHICDNDSYTFLENTSWEKTFNEHGEWVVSSHALGDNKVGRQVLIDTITSSLGCDSAVAHVVYVHPTYLDITRITIGDNVLYEWHGKKFDGKSLDKSVTHIAWDSIQGGTQTYHCDSVYKLELNVARSFQNYDTIHLCTGGTDNSYRWQHLPDIDTTFSNLHKGTYDYNDTLKTKQFACDSIFSIHIVVDTAYLIPVDTTYADICQNGTYTFYDSVCNAKGEWVPAVMGETNSFTLTYNDQTITGCDSLVCHKVTVHPTYIHQHYDTVCQRLLYTWNAKDFEEKHVYRNGVLVDSIATDVVGDFVYYDSLATTTWGCDSVEVLHLNIPHSYRFDSLYTMSDEDSLHWQGRIFVGENFRGDTTGLHAEVVVNSYNYFEEHYPAYYSNRYCDSAYYLTIHLGQVFRDTLYDFTCANEPYSWMTDNASGYHPTHSGTDSLIRTIAPVVAIDTLVRDVYKTSLGFDSIYYLHLHRTPIYDSVFTDTVCQGSRDYLWPRHSTPSRMLYVDGDYSKPVPESEIPTDVAGWVTIVDYLHTATEFPRHHNGDTTMVETSCDSTWTLRLYVAPTYDDTYNTIIDPYTICDNDTLSWERRLFVGHKWQEFYPSAVIDSARYDTVITVTQDITDHFDTITDFGRLTGYGCDSIRFLKLTVNHVEYDTTGTRTICNNDIFTFGHAHPFEWDHHYQFSKEFATAPDTVFALADTVPNRFGCDSVSKVYVTVHPSYRFDTVMDICSSEPTVWRKYDCIRNKCVNFLSTGTYYDSLTTQFGCDSVYVLHLTIRPSKRIVFTDHMCVGDTLWFDGGAYPYDPRYDNMQSDHMVYYVSSYSTENGCDSILVCYPYWHPKFLYEDSAEVCGGESYVWHNSRGDTVLVPLPGEGQEIYYDSLHTHFSYMDAITGELTHGVGCDSVYKFTLKHHATYRDLADYDTICAHTAFNWSKHTTHRLYCKNDGKYYSGSLTPAYVGDWQYVDSMKTIHGCDSIWTLNLHMNPDYYFSVDTTFCTESDVDFDWHGRHIHIPIGHSQMWYDGQHFEYSNTFKTIHACDSTYDMHVHVYVIHRLEEHKTMCTGDFYDFHGKILSQGGVYIDTIMVQSTGCWRITTLHLTEIPPTKTTINVNYLCIDDGQVGLNLAFDGVHPTGYSVIYSDEFLQACADHHLTPVLYENEPLYSTQNYISLSLPTVLEQTQYLRPDDYIATIVFHGVCINDSLTTEQFSYQLRYPSWVMEQHWNDAIGILVDSLNGGYHFTSFQWYKDNQQMIGETHPYLYCPQYLEANSEYSVALTRSSDGKTFMTCPLIPDFSRQQMVTPTQPYISVVPTLVVRENPVVNILCVNPGSFEIFDPYGRLIQSGQFTPGAHNAFEVHLPAMQGVYVFQLSESSGLQRTVKVLVE